MTDHLDEFEYDLYVDQLQAIHALRDALELSDDDYRALLYTLTGSRSAKFMTPEQRGRVIDFMTIYQALDDVVVRAEEAREQLNTAFRGAPEALIDKEVYLDDAPVGTLSASVETIMALMRRQHGETVRLIHAEEVRSNGARRLQLRFGREQIAASQNEP